MECEVGGRGDAGEDVEVAEDSEGRSTGCDSEEEEADGEESNGESERVQDRNQGGETDEVPETEEDVASVSTSSTCTLSFDEPPLAQSTPVSAHADDMPPLPDDSTLSSPEPVESPHSSQHSVAPAATTNNAPRGRGARGRGARGRGGRGRGTRGRGSRGRGARGRVETVPPIRFRPYVGRFAKEKSLKRL